MVFKKTFKETMSNKKQHLQCNNCTNTDNSLSDISVIPTTNNIEFQYKTIDLPTAQNTLTHLKNNLAK